MADKIVVANPSKALIALVGMVCITVLMAVERIPTEAGDGMWSWDEDTQTWVQADA